ncbi:polysaccharide deacetylase family protein [Glaciecola sp. 1036]|uniref:polysaccharide deacetylase family protein n=1 Tax=Alteromonadaceae TaxID=72275 RepID=UPI003CFCD25B
MKSLLKVALLLSIFSLSACATKPNNQRIINQNEDFILVKVQENDSFESLALEFIGSAKYASLIKRYNPESLLSSGGFIAIPRTPQNMTSVFYDGYQKVPILCYHQFTRDRSSSNPMVVTEAEFTQQMAYLHEKGYQVISLQEASEFVRGQRELPDNAVVITIDDGYRSFKDIALPVLTKYQFPSTMFIYPEFIGGKLALSWQDVKSLVNHPLVEIESHSTTHSSLSRNPSGEDIRGYQTRIRGEVEQAQQRIYRNTHQKVRHFAYPYGNTSAELVGVLEQHNYQTGVTVQRGSNPAFSSPYLLNRTMIYGGDSMQTFVNALDTFESTNLQ